MTKPLLTSDHKTRTKAIKGYSTDHLRLPVSNATASRAKQHIKNDAFGNLLLGFQTLECAIQVRA